jgi:membrane-associated phospholipid phosphatase
MWMPSRCGWLLVSVAALVLAGCGNNRLIQRQADTTYQRLAAAGRAGAPAAPAAPAASADRAPAQAQAKRAAPADVEVDKPVLYFAPAEEQPAEAPATGAVDATATAAPAAEKPADELEPIAGRSFGDIVKSDLKAAPRQIWSGTKLSFTKPENLIILSLAFGGDRIVRHNLDEDVRDYFRDDDSSLAATGDFGSVIGNPALHFGVAGLWYAAAVRNGDARNHALSKTMIEALAVTNLSTLLLKLGMNDDSPNGEAWGWPSGHTSSSVCFAAVMHEYYGLKVGLPLYLVAGYSAASRLQDREHDLSDLVFGAALGWVVGHSVVKGELPHVAGFTVLPYGGPSSGGLMLVKRW